MLCVRIHPSIHPSFSFHRMEPLSCSIWINFIPSKSIWINLVSYSRTRVANVNFHFQSIWIEEMGGSCIHPHLHLQGGVVPPAHLSVSIFWELRWSQGWNSNPLPLISVRKHTLFPFGNRWRGKSRNLRRQKWHQLVLPNLSMQWSGHFLQCVFNLYCFLFFTHPTSCWCYQAKLLWIQLLCENLKRSSLFPFSWCCHQLELPPIWSSPLLFLDFFCLFLDVVVSSNCLEPWSATTLLLLVGQSSLGKCREFIYKWKNQNPIYF